jgi:hypothetical protein
MSLSLSGVVYTLVLIVSRCGRSEALGELVATAFCCLIWVISFSLDCHSEPSEARKLWSWHDEMAGPLRSACLSPGLLFSSLSLATTCSLMVYHCQAMAMYTATASPAGRDIDIRDSVRCIKSEMTWSSASSSYLMSVLRDMYPVVMSTYPPAKEDDTKLGVTDQSWAPSLVFGLPWK